MKPTSQSLTVEGKLTNLEIIAEFITKAAQKAGLDKEDVFAIQMAVDEACTNIVEHAYAHKSGDIHLSYEVTPEAFAVTIQDHGQPFDPESVPSPSLKSDLSERPIGGLGLYFMHKLMDQVRFSFDPEKGNQVVMTKRMGTGSPHQKRKDFEVIYGHGRIDASAAPELEAQLQDLLAEGTNQIIVELSDASYISSSGLKALLTALRQARRQRGELVLCNLQPKVTLTLEMIGFDRVFPIAPDLAAAAQLLEHKGP